jgi:hypothetical protein
VPPTISRTPRGGQGWRGRGLEDYRRALRAILEERKRPVLFAEVKKLLEKQTKRPFNPADFGCKSTGGFLRKYAQELDIEARQRRDDWEIHLPGASVARPAAANGRPPATPAAVEHSADLYRQLLSWGYPRFYIVPLAAWEAITDRLFALVRPGGQAVECRYREIEAELIFWWVTGGDNRSDRPVRDVVFQAFQSGCLVRSAGGAATEETDFHYKTSPAFLHPALTTAEALTTKVREHLARILEHRLRRAGHAGALDRGLLDELFAEGAAPDDSAGSPPTNDGEAGPAEGAREHDAHGSPAVPSPHGAAIPGISSPWAVGP